MAANNTSFKPGQSGNPGGRTQNTSRLRTLARTYTEEAVKTIAKIMRSKKSDDRAKVAAASALLDRGWGKPTQPISGDDDMPPISAKVVSDEELLAIIRHGNGNPE